MARFDSAPEKVRIKDSYRERIFKESQQLDKSYLETLYFIVDCYFAFKKSAFPVQQLLAQQETLTHSSTVTSPVEPTPISSNDSSAEDSSDETFSLDFDL